ncbi:MAG: hypothetical protein JWL71_3506 [Acidobacteria bacterium]|jgi:hypothetical protein|nr:hypothetical protein [Acidobacteriota bacterium]
MTVSVDVWLRGTEHATTKTIETIPREPSEWTDDDVRLVLEGMLRVMAQLKQPGQEPRTIALRALSWIVNAYEDGGVVIAIEITLGAAIAGPFDIDKARLEAMITRVMAPPVASVSTRVH